MVIRSKREAESPTSQKGQDCDHDEQPSHDPDELRQRPLGIVSACHKAPKKRAAIEIFAILLTSKVVPLTSKVISLTSKVVLLTSKATRKVSKTPLLTSKTAGFLSRTPPNWKVSGAGYLLRPGYGAPREGLVPFGHLTSDICLPRRSLGEGGSFSLARA